MHEMTRKEKTMKRKKKWKSKVQRLSRKVGCILATALLCGNSLFANAVPVLAKVNTDGAKVINDEYGTDWWSNANRKYSGYDDNKSKALKVEASYGFKLQQTSKTKVTVEEGTSCKAPQTFQDSELKLPDFLKKYTWFKTSENTAGNIQIKISNLKIYQCNADGSNGHWVSVDLVRTVTGISKWKDENGYVALGAGITNAAYVGISEMTTDSKFYKAGTNTAVTLKSNVTLSDIDASQYIGVKADKVDGQYVSSNTKLKFMEDGGRNIYVAENNKDYDSEAFTAVGFIFESNSFQYTFGRQDQRDGDDIEEPTNQEQYVGSGQAMTQFSPAHPTKTVTDDNETEVTKNTVTDLAKTWTYTVEQTVPSGIPQNFYYDKFEFQDQIEECMKILSIKVSGEDSNSESKDVTNLFNISTTGNKVVATLKNTKNADFYKNTVYKLQIKVKMDVPEDASKEVLEALRSKWKEHGHYNQTQTVITEKNNAKTIIDEYNLPTNEVSTDVHLSTSDEDGKDPGLKITKDVNRYEHQVGDIVHYTVKVQNTNPNADTAYFTISDTTLPDTFAFDFSSVKVSGIDAANYTISQSGNGWVLKSKGDYALPYGTTITVEYDAKALVASNGTCVDNTASAIAAGIPEKQDKEQVYINSPKTDVVKTTPDTKHKVGDTVGYKVTITNRNPGTFMRNIILKDLVKTKGLEIKEGSVAVLVGGKDVTSKLEITYNDDSTGFEIQTPYNLKNGDIPCIGIAPYNLIDNWTDKIIVTYDATITDEAALESKLENVFSAPATENTNGDKIKEDETIPSGGGEDTEDVTMKAPQLDITKKSNKQEYSVGETGKYTLTVKQTKEDLTAKNVVITDSFVQEDGIAYDAESIAVKLNNNDITKDCKISVEGNHFKIETGKNLTDEDEMEVTYNVEFSKTGEYTNTAVSTSDNTNEDQSNNVVEVKEATPELTITKKSNKQEYSVGESGTYTLSIKQKNDSAIAKNVVITDKFATSEGVSVDEGSMIVKLNGTDITKDCSITIGNGEFKIETGKDMTSKDEFIVEYQATFSKVGEYKNTATTDADNADPKEDDNEVKVVEQDVIITKDADGKSYKVGDLVSYKVAVSLKKENAVSKNVVITDKIPKELELQADSVKVEGIADYTIDMEDNTLKVTIPNLKYGEKVVVTYKAKVLKDALGKKLTNKATVNGEGIHPGEAEVTVEVPKKTAPVSNPETGSTTSPQTGDTKNMTRYAAAIAVAGVGAVLLLLKKRKLKK